MDYSVEFRKINKFGVEHIYEFVYKKNKVPEFDVGVKCRFRFNLYTGYINYSDIIYFTNNYRRNIKHNEFRLQISRMLGTQKIYDLITSYKTNMSKSCLINLIKHIHGKKELYIHPDVFILLIKISSYLKPEIRIIISEIFSLYMNHWLIKVSDTLGMYIINKLKNTGNAKLITIKQIEILNFHSTDLNNIIKQINNKKRLIDISGEVFYEHILILKLLSLKVKKNKEDKHTAINNTKYIKIIENNNNNKEEDVYYFIFYNLDNMDTYKKLNNYINILLIILNDTNSNSYKNHYITTIAVNDIVVNLIANKCYRTIECFSPVVLRTINSLKNSHKDKNAVAFINYNIFNSFIKPYNKSAPINSMSTEESKVRHLPSNTTLHEVLLEYLDCYY